MSDDHDFGRDAEIQREADRDYEIEVSRQMTERERDDARRRDT